MVTKLKIKWFGVRKKITKRKLKIYINQNSDQLFHNY